MKTSTNKNDKLCKIAFIIWCTGIVWLAILLMTLTVTGFKANQENSEKSLYLTLIVSISYWTLIKLGVFQSKGNIFREFWAPLGLGLFTTLMFFYGR